MQGVDSVAVLPFPFPPGLTPVGGISDDDVVYDIVASSVLPVIDISRSVRTVLFPERVVKRFDRIVTKSRTLLFILSNVAMVLAATIPLYDVRLGRWLAVPTFVIGLPAPIVHVMFMRYEILLLLVRTYDVWFFSITWLVSMVLFTMCLADVRALLTLGIWFAMQTSILVDASPAFRETLWLTSTGLVFSMFMIAAIVLDAFKGFRDFDLFTVNGYVVSAQTVVLNGWSTCLLVLVRNIYRRRAAIRDHGRRNTTVVQCLSYRCRVRLRARGRRRRSANSLSSVTSASSVGSSHMTRPTSSYFQNAKMVQMRCMRVKFKISPRNLVAKIATRLLEYSDTHASIVVFRTLLILLMEAGAILTMASFIPGVPSICQYASLATTALFCAISLCMLHRQLLKYVVFSFDFAFLSFQLTVMHLALCDLYGWDSRAFSIMAVWLWFHWVLTFDCVPPVIKTRVRFRYRYVVLIAVQFVVAHVCLVYQLAAFDRHTFRDRAILHIRIRQVQVDVRVLPLLVSRMIMTFCWSCRIVLRLLRRHENELVIIQGTVTYINNRRKIKVQEAQYLATRTKSTMIQMKRVLTRRLTAFAIAVAPITAPSVPTKIQPTINHDPSPVPIPTQRNGRFVNIAAQVYDAARVIAPLQQGRLLSELRRNVIDSGPMLFQVVNNPRRKSAIESNGAIMKITTLDVSSRSVQPEAISYPGSAPAQSEHQSEVEPDKRFII